MPRVKTKAVHTAKDIWVAYATDLLAKHPDWWSMYSERYRCSHCFIYRQVGSRAEEVMSYPQFRRILEEYLKRARKAIIQGEALNLKASMGKICAKRVERDFRKEKQRQVDWGRTNAIPENRYWDEARKKWAYHKLVYFITDDWSRIAWFKNKKVKGETIYRFDPANPNSARTSGFKLEFTNALNSDPLLKFKYLFQPIIL